MTNELEPCPFCGGKAMLIEEEERHDFMVPVAAVICTKCRCGGLPNAIVENKYKHEAIETSIREWNTRPNDWNYDMEEAPRDGTELEGLDSELGLVTFKWCDTDEKFFVSTIEYIERVNTYVKRFILDAGFITAWTHITMPTEGNDGI
jgi:hypothetical protein